MDVNIAKEKLDKIIEKGRVALYKPIQIAEILYHKRVVDTELDLLDLASYRTKSRRWRDKVSKVLVGNISTSSAPYQDEVFKSMPPECLEILSNENILTGGAVEAYIYAVVKKRKNLLIEARDMLSVSDPSSFSISTFISKFWEEPGLKKSLDKIYEIIVYSLFESIITGLGMTINIEIDKEKIEILNDFEDFTTKVMHIDSNCLNHKTEAHVYRVGIANQADGGIDLYGNWGPAIQVKHLSLSEKLAESIAYSVSSDRIIIVCKNADSELITSIINQLGWRQKVQSIVTEENLIEWYDKALSENYSSNIGTNLLDIMLDQLYLEFPFLKNNDTIILSRNYDNISNDFWKVNDNE